MLNLPYVASIYLDDKSLSRQLLIFHMKMEEVRLESLLISPGVPADQIPLNVDGVERFSTQSERFFVVKLAVSKNQKKRNKKKIEKKLSPFG